MGGIQGVQGPGGVLEGRYGGHRELRIPFLGVLEGLAGDIWEAYGWHRVLGGRYRRVDGLGQSWGF